MGDDLRLPESFLEDLQMNESAVLRKPLPVSL